MYLLANANLCLFAASCKKINEADTIFNESKKFYESLPEKSKNHNVKFYYSGLLAATYYLKPYHQKDYNAVTTNAEEQLHFDFIHRFIYGISAFHL